MTGITNPTSFMVVLIASGLLSWKGVKVQELPFSSSYCNGPHPMGKKAKVGVLSVLELRKEPHREYVDQLN